MTLSRAWTLLLLMASRQQEMTWFLGFPTEEKSDRCEDMGRPAPPNTCYRPLSWRPASSLTAVSF